ncbi:MAG: hypothetical protein JXO22_14750, partial [Phycisphaerae bacterium]|nr:hypothetical protein [Phycisphaerae bacterium]
GFVTVPAIMHFMPGGAFWGSFFGALWFGLLFLAAVTSSLSMLQPAIAFLEDGFGLGRRSSVAVLGVVTAAGAALTMYFSKNVLALDYTDFWCNLLMIIAATGLVIMFGWVIGAKRGVREMNRGADFRVPKFMAFMLRYITPAFLILILIAWSWNTLPGYLEGMDPSKQRTKAMEAKAEAVLLPCCTLPEQLANADIDDAPASDLLIEALAAAGADDDPEEVRVWVTDTRAAADAYTDQTERRSFLARELMNQFGLPPLSSAQDVPLVAGGFLAVDTLNAKALANRIRRLSAYGETFNTDRVAAYVEQVRAEVAAAGKSAVVDANVARFVFLGIFLFLLLLFVLSDVACRNRIGRTIEQAEQAGIDWEAAT